MATEKKSETSSSVPSASSASSTNSSAVASADAASSSNSSATASADSASSSNSSAAASADAASSNTALLCKVELSQKEGIKVTVINKAGKITQTMVFNGTSMVHTCKKGESDTDSSTITQTFDTITIKCKNFNVDAETINCKSTKNTDHKAEGTFTVDSTQKATFKTAADMEITASTDLKMNSTDFTSKGKSTAEVTSLTTTINGDTKTSVTSAKLELTGSANVDMKGAIVKVAADATMNVEGGAMTTVKGAMTNIQGSLVKIG